MKQAKRVFLIVLDSFGVGAAPDASDFGDEGANTLGRVLESPQLDIPNLTRLGLLNIQGVKAPARQQTSVGSYARLREVSKGKDTTIGHWELAGVVSPRPLPTFPEGFPPDCIAAFEKAVGRGVLCNRPYSGTNTWPPASSSSTPRQTASFRSRPTRAWCRPKNSMRSAARPGPCSPGPGGWAG